MHINSHHTLMVLLHYLVKCITRYYCTVNMFHTITKDQQTLLQFIDILKTQLVDMLLMMPQIVYATRLRSGLFYLVIWTVVLPASETRQSHKHCGWALSYWKIKNFSISWQLTSGTHVWTCAQVKGVCFWTNSVTVSIMWNFSIVRLCSNFCTMCHLWTLAFHKVV